MKELIELYCGLRNDALKNGSEVAQLFGVENHEDPANFFNMVFNTITMTIELLDHYYTIWGNPNRKDIPNIVAIKEQNGQRVILLQKMCFIDVMSAFEFCAKKIALGNGSLFGEFKGRIYLTGIMKRSQSKGIIDKTRFSLWIGTSKLRNVLVHNNGIAEDNVQYEYPDVNLLMQKNAMIQGDLRLFALVTKWLISEARIWLENVNNASLTNYAGR